MNSMQPTKFVICENSYALRGGSCSKCSSQDLFVSEIEVFLPDCSGIANCETSNAHNCCLENNIIIDRICSQDFHTTNFCSLYSKEETGECLSFVLGCEQCLYPESLLCVKCNEANNFVLGENGSFDFKSDFNMVETHCEEM